MLGVDVPFVDLSIFYVIRPGSAAIVGVLGVPSALYVVKRAGIEFRGANNVDLAGAVDCDADRCSNAAWSSLY